MIEMNTLCQPLTVPTVFANEMMNNHETEQKTTKFRAYSFVLFFV